MVLFRDFPALKLKCMGRDGNLCVGRFLSVQNIFDLLFQNRTYVPPGHKLCRLENIKWSLIKQFPAVLPRKDHSPRDHHSVENLVEREEGHVVQPEDCRGGQDRGVDNKDGKQEESKAETG